MKDLIKKIEPVPDVIIERHLQWLSQGKSHVLNSDSTEDVIRYLIKKVDELEDKIQELQSKHQ